MDNLRNLRRMKGYTQLQLASFMEVGASVVSRWETGLTAPSLVQIVKLCRILDCSPSLLYKSCAQDSDMIPVFTDNSMVFQPFSSCCTENKADFGIVVSHDTAGRLCAGDVCFFTIQNSALNGSIVLVSPDEYSWDIVLYDDSRPKNIIAVCTALHGSI